MIILPAGGRDQRMKKKNAKDNIEKKSSARILIISLAVSVFFVGIILIYYRSLYLETRQGIVKTGEMMALKSADQFDDYLVTALDAVQLTSYTVENMQREQASDTEILNYIVLQTSAVTNTIFENTTGLYGYINGTYMDGALWVPEEGYDPTKRRWYTEACEKGGEIALIEPYVDAQTGELIMTIAKRLEDGQSVVALDLSLDRIQRIAEEAVEPGGSDIEIILDRDGLVIAHSNHDEVGKRYSLNTDNVGGELIRQMAASERDYYDFHFRNAHYIAYCESIGNDWRCLSVKNTTAIFRPLNVLFFLTLAVVVISLFILVQIFRHAAKRNLLTAKLAQQLQSATNIYIAVHEVDVIQDTFSDIITNNQFVEDNIGNSNRDAQRTLLDICEKVTDIISKEEVLRFVNLSTLEERLADRKSITLEFLAINNRWHRGRFIVSQRTEDGRISHVLWMVEDIDEEKRNRDMMLEAIRRMNDQIGSIANIYFSMHDIDLPNNRGNEIKTNVKRITELIDGRLDQAQEMMYHVMGEMCSPQSRQEIMDFLDFSTLNRRLKDKDTITQEFLSIKGVWCRARFLVSSRFRDGSIDHVLWLVEGIDEEKRRRDRLMEETQKLNAQIASVAAIYMTMHEINIEDDSFVEIRSQNEVVKGILGNSHNNAQSLLNQIMKTVTDDSAIDEMMRFIDLSTLNERLKDTDKISIEYMIKNKLWRRGRFIVSQRHKDGRISHVLWMVEDIDQEKKYRDRLIDLSERAIAANEAKSSFLSNMSHEIRTPINAVLGMNEMILRESEEPEILSYSENIRTAGNTLLGLINDILDFSKIEAGKMEIIPTDYDLSSMLNDLVHMIELRAEEKGLAFLPDFDPHIPKHLFGDEVRIKQIIMNILTNAVKYTEKGSVTFRVSFVKDEMDPEAILLKVSVKDTGIGIRKEDQAKLFTMFERIDEERNRNIEGTGLGMNITGQLLAMMGSTLEVESEYGAGSDFSFVLKQKVTAWDELGDYEKSYREANEKKKKYKERFRAPEARILVVDDNRMNLTVFVNLLKKTGIRIDTATGGDEALRLSAKQKYDLIFLDHMMPEKDGIETLHELRASSEDPNSRTSVICLTANAISGAREQYLAEGFDDYLTKPIDSDHLEEQLIRYLPEDKVMAITVDETEIPNADLSGIVESIREQTGLDTEAGLKNNGGRQGYLEILRVFMQNSGNTTEEIRNYYAEGDLKNATIKIHAMKSMCRIIGAAGLGERAQRLENAGNAGDRAVIDKELEAFLGDCRDLGDRIRPLLPESKTEEEDLPPIDPATLQRICGRIPEMADEFDSDGLEKAVEELESYALPEEEKQKLEKLRHAVDNYDYDTIRELYKT